MRNRMRLTLMAGCLLVAAIGGITFYEKVNLLSRLPHFYEAMPSFQRNDYGKYEVKPYVEAVIRLQSMGQQRSEQCMVKYARQNKWSGDQIYILCRMLYTKPIASDFKSPPLGLPSCIGGTNYKNWPLNPIEIVDGVPFLIATGFSLYGAGGTPLDYISYCMTNCEWNTFLYKSKSDEELKTALNKMLNSSKWNRPLREDEKQGLSLQIR